MGVQHVENPDNRSIYQPLLAAVPVLSRASGDFVVEQVCERSKKNPLRCRSGFFVF
jgi:hypothetical protein